MAQHLCEYERSRVIAELEKLPEGEQDAIAKRCCEAQIATRLLAELEEDHIYWFWIGAHAEYD